MTYRALSVAVAVAVGGVFLGTGVTVPPSDPVAVVTATGSPEQPPLRHDHARPGQRVGDGPTVLDEQSPSVSRLDPELLAALRRAAADAARDGVVLRVNSGWRSAAEQERLLREAVAEHGSAEEAARWVATPETSAHVSGDAVDVGPADAARWLARHGAAHGLCQVYDNEPWHYELRPDAVDDGCPDRYADPTEDPRLRR